MCGVRKSTCLAKPELLHYLGLVLHNQVIGRGRPLGLLLPVYIPGGCCIVLIQGGIPPHGGQFSLGLCSNVDWHGL